MNSTYLVILKLTSLEASYSPLILYLKSGISWARPLPSVWFIKTPLTASAVRDGIKKRINSSDGVLVIEVPKNSWGTYNISNEITQWMNQNLGK